MINYNLSQLVICPNCHAALNEEDTNLVCCNCNKIYPVRYGIPDFRDKDEYWCNVSRDKINKLNKLAESSSNWFKSAKQIIPEYIDHFTYFYRADSQFLWPTNKNSKILDAGCMWGGLTIPAAQFHQEVYAVDKTSETLEFLKIRAKQMGIKNIYTFAAEIKKLPFPDNFFDFVVLNGVLEWVGLEEKVILEKHWKGKREEKQLYSQTPRQMQINVLKELRRVLKPKGSLYIAIENRYGIQYLMGYPDDHNNVRFVSFLPRFLADKISRIVGKGKYRTYIYSPKQLIRLLKKAGFKNNLIYGLFPHYIKIKKAFLLSMAGLFKNEVQINGSIFKILHKAIRTLIPKALIKHTIPSLFAIAGKSNQSNLIPRLKNLLIRAKVISENDQVNFVISNNRYQNCNSTNFIIYNADNHPIYFCKVSRKRDCSGLSSEAQNLKWISKKILTTKEINFQIPKLIYFGVIDDIEILITDFLNVKNVEIYWHYLFNKGLDKVGINNLIFRKNIGFVEEKIFLSKINSKMESAIDALVEFQKITACKKISMKEVINNMVNKFFECNADISEEINKKLFEIQSKMKNRPDLEIMTSAIHGDYDFDNVLFSSDKTVNLVDFEHLEKEGCPFFDLVTLIFNPLIIKWKSSNSKIKSFNDYLDMYDVKNYVIKWFKYFCDKCCLPYSIIPIMLVIAVIEQNVKEYPFFRDPNSYPMYGEDMLKELILIEMDKCDVFHQPKRF
jgi:SAM-dependent methyltransferase/fructosamine-3-kinase